ncbi:hypothetical protein ACGF0D_42725 [Kitasatospora sp. NPDC048298]|uniref:hypothetical protein n=1 Tax=Kitasatospora sp. NPDC048298 TaxID=3364049 RepID=UPI003711A034
MTTRRPLGPGVDRDHQDVAVDTPHRPGLTAAELAALAAPAHPVPPVPVDPARSAPTGRRPLAVRPDPAPADAHRAAN